MWLYLKFRFHRLIRRYRREFKVLQARTASYFDRHVWGKWRQLSQVRRFVLIWAGIMALVGFGLIGQVNRVKATALTIRPVEGGTYREGLLGSIKTINPILPEDGASTDATRLIFSGLTRYDSHRQVESDLAESWKTSDDGKVYIFKLRRNVKWHDGAPFTAADVLFTLAAIQNPDTRSPLAPNWQGVKVEAENDYTVVFTLPNPYTPFLYSTTVGILPNHLLGKVEAKNLRVANFNQAPVGTGPFQLKRFKLGDPEMTLDAYPKYHLGKPLLEHFNLHFYANYLELLQAYARRQIDAVSRLKSDDPQSIRQLGNIKIYDLTLPDETGLFFRTASPQLTDKAVRQALAKAIDRSSVIKTALADNATPVSLPLLAGQLGFSNKFLPPSYDPAGAAAGLEAAGWKLTGETRQKDGQVLTLRLVTANSGDYAEVAENVKASWTKIGIKVELTVADINTLQQSHIRARNYDVLLYGLNIGADPDVYAFWHSSQANDPGLNISQYSSPIADKALEGARITSDAATRANKYGTFLATWVADTPAVILYSPRYIYATIADVRGVAAKKLVDPADRFYGVEHWTMRTKLVPK